MNQIPSSKLCSLKGSFFVLVIRSLIFGIYLGFGTCDLGFLVC